MHAIKFKCDFNRATGLDIDDLCKSTSRSTSASPSDVCWIVLPFNHCWAAGRFQKVLREAMLVCPMLLKRFDFRIAWRLGEPNLTLVLRNDSKVKMSALDFSQLRAGG